MLLRFSQYFLYLSLLSVAVVLPTTFFPFIGGKYYFFRFCIEFALIFAVFAWAFEDAGKELVVRLRRVFREPLTIAVSIFVLVLLASSVFAHDRSAAFWSNYERGDGMFQILHYYVFFVLMLLVLKTREDWRALMRVLLAAGIFVVGYGILVSYRDWIAAIFGFPSASVLLLGPVGVQGWLNQRFWGSLGNAAYTGSFLLFLQAWIAWLFLDSKIRRERIFLGVLSATFLYFFLFTQTRGSFVALVLGAFAFLAYLAFRLRHRLRPYAAGVLIVCILTGSAAWAFRSHPAVKDLPIVGRLLRLNVNDRSITTRAWVWEAAWKGFRERPLLGWGLENFTYVYDKYFDPRHFEWNQNSDTWYDRAHNVFFDYLIAAGALGILSYLALVITLLFTIFRIRFREGPKGVVATGVLFAFTVAYLVQGILLFDVLPTYLHLFALIGFTVFLRMRSKESKEHHAA